MSLWKKFVVGFKNSPAPEQIIESSSIAEPITPVITTQVNTAQREEMSWQEALDLGKNYDQGKSGYSQDHNQALHYYKRADELGSPTACFFIGVLYRYGLGCDKNLDLAIKYFEKAIVNGISEAYVYLAYLYNDEQMQRISAAKCWEKYFETELFNNNGETKLEINNYMYTKFASVLAYSELIVDYGLSCNKKDVVINNKNALLEHWTESYLTCWNEGDRDYCDKYKKYIQFLDGKVPKEHGLDVDANVIEYYDNGIDLMNNHSYLDALQCFNMVVDIVGSNYLDTFESMAFCYINLGMYSDAITSLKLALKGLTDSNSKSKILAHFAFCYQMLGLREEAYDSLMESINYNKNAIYELYEFVIDNLGWELAINSKSSKYLNMKTSTGNNNPKNKLIKPSTLGSDDFLDSLTLSNNNHSFNDNFETAEQYYYGIGGIEKDYKKALKYYVEAANQGFPEAYLKLGTMYRDGEGCRVNPEKALEYLKEGVRLGNGNCYAEMADLFTNSGELNSALLCWRKYFNSDTFVTDRDNRPSYVISFFNYLPTLEIDVAQEQDIIRSIYSIQNEITQYTMNMIERLEASNSDGRHDYSIDRLQQISNIFCE